jgi:diaminopropionate ammonia-lyase
MSDHVFMNPDASGWRWSQNDDPSMTKSSSSMAVLDLHRTLPGYDRTPLHSLPSLAAELELGHVLLKDESNRFGLPSFKILGASYGVYRAVADRLGIPIDEHGPSLETVGSAARARGLALVTCTEGNWGRAVARMAKYLGVPAKIFVPSFMPVTTQERVRGEGAEVVVVRGNYDDSVAAAKQEAASNGSLLVMDFGWDGYEKIPQV